MPTSASGGGAADVTPRRSGRSTRSILLCCAGILASALSGCAGDPENAPAPIRLDRDKQLKLFSAQEMEAFCDWVLSTNTMALGSPFWTIVDWDECVEVSRPPCAYGLFVDCAASLDASSLECDQYRRCTAPTYPPENRLCESAECPASGHEADCFRYLYTEGAWRITAGLPISTCPAFWGTQYHCQCEAENAPELSCGLDVRLYSSRAEEGSCLWYPRR